MKCSCPLYNTLMVDQCWYDWNFGLEINFMCLLTSVSTPPSNCPQTLHDTGSTQAGNSHWASAALCIRRLHDKSLNAHDWWSTAWLLMVWCRCTQHDMSPDGIFRREDNTGLMIGRFPCDETLILDQCWCARNFKLNMAFVCWLCPVSMPPSNCPQTLCHETGPAQAGNNHRANAIICFPRPHDKSLNVDGKLQMWWGML